MKTCSILSIIREIQLHQLLSEGQKVQSIAMHVKKGEPYTLFLVMQISLAITESSMEVLQKLET